MKVLYVEDNEQDADLVRRTLAARGTAGTIDVAASLAGARERIEAPVPYDVALLDLRLPDGDGMALLREIRAKQLPTAVAILTGQGDEAAAIAALKAGADDYVVKRPGYLEALPDVLERMLSGFRERATRRTRGLRVLYAETHAADIALARRHLEQHAPHMKVEVVHRASEVLARLPESPDQPCAYDVLLMDYRLPGDSAIDVLHRLVFERRLDLPVVLVTGQGDEEVAAEALRLGAADYLTKHPGYLFELPATLENAFHRAVLARERAALARSEARLREAAIRHRLATESGKVGLWDWDLRTNRVLYSSEWKRQIGYAEHELTDDYEEWHDRVHPDDLGTVLRAIEEYRRSPSEDFETEFRFRHRDGSYRVILARATLVCDERGEAERMVGVHVDITERVHLQAQLLHAQKMESIGLLAGGVAHDFNNLLTIIFSASDLALGSLPRSSRERQYVLEARQAAERAADLTRQLLALGRRQARHPVVLNLNDAVSATLKMLRRILGERIELKFVPGRGLANTRIDSGQLEQVVMNLAVNARDAMPGGGTLTLATLDRGVAPGEVPPGAAGPAGRYVVLSVADTGSGIDEATRERIFEPFFTTKERGRGSGLGLSTVHGIVEQNGGFIRVASEAGKGARFEIFLPGVDAPAERIEAAPPPRVTGGSETVLVAEDEAGVREVVTRVLESAGYSVVQAASGDEALARLRDHAGPLHLLLTDLVMPGLDARLAAEQAVAQRPGLKVAYLSGYSESPPGRPGAAAAEFRFLQKPFRPAELLRFVREVLDSGA